MRNRERGAIFRQSICDFPQMVRLGEKSPSFGLHRFRQGLRFIPADDEGFSLWGDKQRLIYKGRQRSHRFTILGDTAFEYDCILQREPDSNIIRLRIEGAENFDFFKQPDFVKNPFLQGSYAVYKKVTLLGEGTGKLCHIHRPLIIDARGRRCWGALAVVGNELQITIPEKWLSEAAYPVVVDPVVGTTTIGSLEYYNMEPFIDEYGNQQYKWGYIQCDDSMFLNKVLISENTGTTGTVYVYKNYIQSGFLNRFQRTYPAIYNNINNLPKNKISVNEQEVFNNIINQSEWVCANIGLNSSISAGEYIWIGIRGYNFYLSFDYGGILEHVNVQATYWFYDKMLPDVLGDVFFSPYMTTVYNRVLKISMYLDYARGAYNYVTKLVQGVALNDTRNMKTDYKRTVLQFVNEAAFTKPLVSFFRKCVMDASNSMGLERLPIFLRSVFDRTEIQDILKNRREIFRRFLEKINVTGNANRSKGFFREIYDNFYGIDNSENNILFVRSVNETQGITDGIQKWGDYIRGLFIEAGNIAETSHIGRYYRKENDRVQVKGAVLRQIFYILKIMTKAFVRDYIIGRFLIAREELILKSCVVREICIDSRIN